MAQKKQKDKADLVLEFVRILPVNEIAMSDNMESRPKRGKRRFFSPQFKPEACNCTGRLE